MEKKIDKSLGSVRSITSNELIAMDNDEVATELFFILVKHGEKSINDVAEIAKGIKFHSNELKRRIHKNRKETSENGR